MYQLHLFHETESLDHETNSLWRNLRLHWTPCGCCFHNKFRENFVDCSYNISNIVFRLLHLTRHLLVFPWNVYGISLKFIYIWVKLCCTHFELGWTFNICLFRWMTTVMPWCWQKQCVILISAIHHYLGNGIFWLLLRTYRKKPHIHRLQQRIRYIQFIK